jgi:hypothetical protein
MLGTVEIVFEGDSIGVDRSVTMKSCGMRKVWRS